LLQRSGLNRILIPDDDLPPMLSRQWRTINVPDEIESLLLARNREHFSQAHGTPSTIEPLAQLIDWNAASMTSELILTGSYDASELGEITRSVLVPLTARQQDLIPTEISITDLKAKYKSWNESTSTSPSGRHLGHFKALLIPNPFPASVSNQPNPEHDLFEAKRGRIWELHHLMLNYALTHGFPYTRWQTVVNCMIEKDLGQPKTHRLRVIHLYKKDNNLILAMKWRTLTFQNETDRTFNQGQYGARPGLTAYDPVYIENLQNKIARASRRPYVKFSNDAQACYDHMIPNLANLASRAFGMNPLICKIQGETLRKARYKLKTALRISDAEYHHIDLFPIYGTGQGSGSSPALWLVTSSILFDAYEKRAHGSSYLSPDRQHSASVYMISFVDDSCCQVLAPNDGPFNEQTLIDLIRDDAQLWSDLLYVSGGKLAL
jgi:hypothetical protein